MSPKPDQESVKEAIIKLQVYFTEEDEEVVEVDVTAITGVTAVVAAIVEVGMEVAAATIMAVAVADMAVDRGEAMVEIGRTEVTGGRMADANTQPPPDKPSSFGPVKQTCCA